jgi:hypothetical protein
MRRQTKGLHFRSVSSAKAWRIAGSTLLFSTLLHSTRLHSTLLYSTILYSTIIFVSLLYSTLIYSNLLHSLLLYNHDRHSLTPLSSLSIQACVHTRPTRRAQSRGGPRRETQALQHHNHCALPPQALLSTAIIIACYQHNRYSLTPVQHHNHTQAVASIYEACFQPGAFSQ